MRNKNVILLYMVLIMLIVQLFVAPISGYAQPVYGNLNVNDSTMKEVYGVKANGTTYNTQVYRWTMNGKLVFCIEPYQSISAFNYEGYPDQGSIPRRALLATALWDKVLNPNSVNDFEIAQGIVWSNLEGRNKFDVTRIVGISEAYFQAKKKELNDLITNYDKKPSFDGKTIKLKLGETTEIPNTVAGVDLREFDKQVSNSANVRIETKQDRLLITPMDRTKKSGNLLFKKSYKEGTPYIYKSAGSQTLYDGKINSTNSYTLNFDIETTGSIEITKVDVADGYNKIPNAEFTIYNEKGQEIVKGKTNEEGIVKLENLPFGKYTFRETTAPEGYLINDREFTFEILKNGEIIKQKVEDEKIPSLKTTATDKYDGTKELHTSKKVTIQDKVEYKDLLVGKEYTVKGNLMDKSTNQPLLVEGKEVTAEAKLVPKEANGSILLDFTFDATGLEEKQVVVFEDLMKEGKTVTTHADINDTGQTVKFVKPAVQTTAT
ncbi:VaFE repeat-containing surface-anchored protein, partial [Bacillus wiedmannii]|uniref:VaFE repeat-containing surface-anchored protein n=1 Tax=Bacillus wiedmannii TaxID=1890302 RepID=UPI00211D9106